MVVAVVVTLLVFWVGVGAVLALLIGRAARIADDRRQDALLIGAVDALERETARV